MADAPDAPRFYANVVDVTAGPFDLVMQFGYKTPDQTRRGSTDYEHVAEIAMSLGHAKTMLPMLARVIASYEKNVGQIPAPGFDDSAKE